MELALPLLVASIFVVAAFAVVVNALIEHQFEQRGFPKLPPKENRNGRQRPH